MPPLHRNFKIITAVILAVVISINLLSLITVNVPLIPKVDPLYTLPFGPNPFFPSAASTASGFMIKDEFYPDDNRCNDCHAVVVDEYENTPHDLSAREPTWELKE